MLGGEKLNKANKLRNVILLAFALSGMSALIYEIVWTRPIQLIFGSTIYAVSTILTSFMFGFALGSYSFRNIADKARNPLFIFAGIELTIGLYGFFVLGLFKILPSIYLFALNLPGFQFLQFILVFAVIIIPATLFGATWPIINKAYSNMEQLGGDTGLLYSLNSLGAVIGSLAAGFLLIPLFGIKKTSLLAASLNLLIAILIFVYLKGGKNLES
jgi:spermidine synthase